MPEAQARVPDHHGHLPGYLDGASAVEAAQKLIDGGLLGDTAPARPRQGSQDQATQSTPTKVSPDDGKEAPEAAGDADAEDQAQQQSEADSHGDAYASLDDYLTKSELDRDSFYSLPVKVKVDGKEFDAPLAKLVESYQLREHLSHRDNALAEQRRAFDAERETATKQLAAQIQAATQFTQAAYQQLLGAAPTAEQYPDSGQLALAQLQFNNRAQALQQQYAQLQSAQTQVSAETLRAEQQKLFDAMPDWRDPTKFQEASKQLSSYAASRGFTPAELSQVTDHRYFLVLNEAMRARDLQAEVDTLKQQLTGKVAANLKIVRAAPPMATPGARLPQNPKNARLQQARTAMRSGNMRSLDAQAAVAQALIDAGVA